MAERNHQGVPGDDWGRTFKLCAVVALLTASSVLALDVCAVLSAGTYNEPQTVHALPDPFVPQCYTVWGQPLNYCELRVRQHGH